MSLPRAKDKRIFHNDREVRVFFLGAVVASLLTAAWQNFANVLEAMPPTKGGVACRRSRSNANNSAFGLITALSYNENTSAFDAIAAYAYNSMLEQLPELPQETFDVKKWKSKSTGGLKDPDRKLLAEIYGSADSVFEYGLGESTLIANHVGVPRYAGIDSDANWVATAKSHVSKSYRFYYANIGKTARWGYPESSEPKQILTYQLAPLIVEPLPFDVYMVDGRFRFACVLASFLFACFGTWRSKKSNHRALT